MGSVGASGVSLYTCILRSQIPRLIGLLDRTPASPTYGCFDRSFWHLKLVTDFPGATYQQAVLSLAWLATRGSKKLCSVERYQLAEWARAAMLFWGRIQNRDGSFNEWYDQEHSYCPTAFTTFAISEALLLLSEQLPADDVTIIRGATERAGHWLAREHNAWVANQNMAALNALHNVWLLTANEEFRRAAERKLASILQTQDSEGWFPEYGGADPGYSLIAIDLLAHYWTKTHDARVNQALDRLLQFLSSFVQPDGTMADCGSRATQHVLPYGLELLAHSGYPTAGRILSGLQWAMAANQSLTPDRVDDRYFVYFYINSYVGASQACSGEHVEWDGVQNGNSSYTNAGLGVFSTGSRTTVISFKRNNMLRVFVDKTLAYADAGYRVSLEKGRQGWSCGFDPRQTWSMSSHKESLVVQTSGQFYGSVPAQSFVIPLKILGSVALRSSVAAKWFNQWLKSREVASPRRLPILMEREVRLKDSLVTVTDRIILLEAIDITNLILIEEGSVAYSPSAGFYIGLPTQRLGQNVDADALTKSFTSRRQITVTKDLYVDESNGAVLQVRWQ